MKNVLVYDCKRKYFNIVKSFLLAQNCRVSSSFNEAESLEKLGLGIFDGMICIDSLPKNLYKVVKNLYEDRIIVFFIGSMNNIAYPIKYHLNEPFSLLDFALLIKNFVNAMQKIDNVYYISAKKDSVSINCILENPTSYGAILYPSDYNLSNIKLFDDFFKNQKGLFEINFIDKIVEFTVIAKPVFYEYMFNKVIKEVFVCFIEKREELKKMYI